jgi:2-polyprenyl-6-methoxyphenol hydroxylase-like FAD-dependent oxidoreductase
MGIVDQVLALSWNLHAFTVFDRKRQIVRITFDEVDSPYPFVASLPQSDTERILAQRFTVYGGTIERGATLQGITHGPDSVDASIVHSNGTEEQFTCKWLVGCDGARSAVRHLLKIPFDGGEYREDYVLADVEYETSLDTTEQYLFSGEQGVVGFHAFSANRARIFADLGTSQHASHSGDECPTDETKPELPTLEKLQTLMDERGPGTLRLPTLHWLSMHHIHRRQVKSYRQGRVFLSGDAAHLHSPASGQGMNTGIQDAYNLAWKLALVEQAVAHMALLDSYSPERHAVGQGVLTMTDFFSRINTVRNPLAQRIRNIVGPILAKQEVILHCYRNAVTELSPNYRRSPAVAEHKSWFEFSPCPHAGDRAPDGHFYEPGSAKQARLFDLFRHPQHQLLLFAGLETNDKGLNHVIEIAKFTIANYASQINVHLLAVDQKLWMNREVSGSTYTDSDLATHKKYGAKTDCLYLIRPDGYIGFRSMPADKDSFSQYLQTIFL